MKPAVFDGLVQKHLKGESTAADKEVLLQELLLFYNNLLTLKKIDLRSVIEQ